MTANVPTTKANTRFKMTRIFPTAVMALSPFGAGAVYAGRPAGRSPEHRPASRPCFWLNWGGTMPHECRRVNYNFPQRGGGGRTDFQSVLFTCERWVVGPPSGAARGRIGNPSYLHLPAYRF